MSDILEGSADTFTMDLREEFGVVLVGEKKDEELIRSLSKMRLALFMDINDWSEEEIEILRGAVKKMKIAEGLEQ